MNYLFLGEDSDKKELKIAEIKTKVLPSPDAQKFDYEVLYAHKLSPEVLKKTLIDLPAVAKKRLVLLHDGHKLSPQNKKLILEFVSAEADHVVLLLESREWEPGDSFVKKIKPYVKILDFLKQEKLNVFNMTRAMTLHRKQEALKILFGLLAEGVHPLQIMGGLVWFWGKSKGRMAPQSFEKGLEFLQEADLNIKRSRLRPDYSLEVLVVKLCGILR